MNLRIISNRVGTYYRARELTSRSLTSPTSRSVSQKRALAAIFRVRGGCIRKPEVLYVRHL